MNVQFIIGTEKRDRVHNEIPFSYFKLMLFVKYGTFFLM
jgi:hypothetical protein